MLENTLLNHLDDPARFLYFTLDEAFVLLGGFILGALGGKPFLGLVISIILMMLLHKSKKLHENCTIAQLIYWLLPTSKTAFHLYVPSYLRELRG